MVFHFFLTMFLVTETEPEEFSTLKPELQFNRLFDLKLRLKKTCEERERDGESL
jgi:hypothetical protein